MKYMSNCYVLLFLTKQNKPIFFYIMEDVCRTIFQIALFDRGTIYKIVPLVIHKSYINLNYFINFINQFRQFYVFFCDAIVGIMRK